MVGSSSAGNLEEQRFILSGHREPAMLPNRLIYINHKDDEHSETYHANSDFVLSQLQVRLCVRYERWRPTGLISCTSSTD